MKSTYLLSILPLPFAFAAASVTNLPSNDPKPFRNPEVVTKNKNLRGGSPKDDLDGPGALDKVDHRSLSDTTPGIQYNQMGVDISGSVREDATGHAVAISKNGQRMALSSPGERSGHVRIYDWNITDWVQVGNSIIGHDGSCPGCMDLGYAIDMNDEGTRVIVGAPKSNRKNGIVSVYELDSQTETWSRLGSEIGKEIIPENSRGHAGESVTMNGAGNRIAFGAPQMNSYKGCIFTMELVDNEWIMMGERFDASGYYASAGGSVAMDSTGERLVFGSTYGNWFVGRVDIFDFDRDNNQWVSSHSTDGEMAYYDQFGGDVDISDNGERVVVGSTNSDANGKKNSGAFKVLEYDSFLGEWSILGGVNGDSAFDKMGEAVSISGDGNYVAVSSPKSDHNFLENNGKIEIFTYSTITNEWIRHGDAIQGTSSGDRLGEGNGAIALDFDGTHVVTGAGRGNYYCGKARVYEASAAPAQ